MTILHRADGAIAAALPPQVGRAETGRAETGRAQVADPLSKKAIDAGVGATMGSEALRRLLAGTYPDPDGAGMLSVATRAVVIAETLMGAEDALVAPLGLGGTLAVVCDQNTRLALGERVATSLRRIAAVEEIVLPGRLHADEETVAAVRARTADATGLVAVGSGTINDICKYAAVLDAKPYAVFATAPSMNGYTSVNAAITRNGHKLSLAAAAPVGVFADLRVLAQAPPRMIRAGLGDSLCRPTAQRDWVLSHHLLGTPYREAPFVLLAEDEEALLSRAAGLVNGDLTAVRHLVQTLIMSGFGMTICGGSYPASQGEHLISHYVEMMGDKRWPETLHGEMVGVTTLNMARLQEMMLTEEEPVAVGAAGVNEDALAARYGEALGRSCAAQLELKIAAGNEAGLAQRLREVWPELKNRLRALSPSSTDLEGVLLAAGCSTRAEELGLPSWFFRDAFLHAREIRDRYTFLDLAADTGHLIAFEPR